MVRLAGHKHASWAHAIVRQIRDDVRLLLPGAGPAERHVRFFAATTGYDDEVFLTGDRFSPAEALAAGDIALFLYEQDVGVSSLADAMAAGLPIVAADTPEVAECVPDGTAGLLTPIHDPRAASAAILRIIEEPKLAQRLVESVKQLTEQHFAPNKARKALAEVYKTAARTRIG
jgi:phosphatidylinositol alpha-mannosyltransferase